jgi:hypothetical protein
MFGLSLHWTGIPFVESIIHPRRLDRVGGVRFDLKWWYK